MRFLISLILILLCGCASDKAADIPVSVLAEKMSQAAEIKNAEIENFSDRAICEKYGLEVNSISGGVAIFNRDANNADKVIVILAKDNDALRKVERAIESEKVRLADAVENDKSQNTKEIITKTKDKYVALIMSEKSKEAEKIFDEMLMGGNKK